MKIDSQEFLDLVEETRQLAFVDIEATGLKGDYNSILVISIKPYKEPAKSFFIKQAGNDRAVVREAIAEMNKYSCWVTYYGKGFDIPMINTRALKWELAPLKKKPHLDMYYTLKANLITARRSQGHLLSWLELPEQKMSVSADMWAQVVNNPAKVMPIMIDRCESDVEGLEALYCRTRHLIREIKA